MARNRTIVVMGAAIIISATIGFATGFYYFYWLHPSHTWRFPLGQDEVKRQLAYRDAVMPALSLGLFCGLCGFLVVYAQTRKRSIHA